MQANDNIFYQMTTINERVGILIDALKLNKNSFSISIGVDPTVIHNIVGGRLTKPSFEVLEKILLSHDNINLEWFILGKGDQIFKDKTSEVKKKYLNVAESPANYNDQNKLMKELERLRTENEVLYKAFRELGKRK
jgi:hypothetical protein